MLSKWKLSVLAVCGVFCAAGGFTAFAETETSEASTEASTEATTETSTEETTESSEPEEITSGDYTYYFDEDYDGAVLTAWKPDEADVTIPETIDGITVVALDDFLFNGQDTIETVTIPVTLRHMGASVFYGTSIREFIVEDDNPAYKAEDGVLFSNDGVALIAYPPKKEDTAYVVPDGVEELYHGCFAQATNLESLTLPDGLIYIDTWAFAYTILQTLDLPDTVTEMQSYACAFMDRLESIKMPSQLTYIGSAAFAGCAQLTDVTLNDGLLEIGQGAFAGAGMKSIVVPSSVDTIGYCAFGYEKDMETSNSNFVIYGVSGSAAQTYATDTDSEYDYTNNFTFISKTDDQIAEMLSGESDAEEDAADDPVEVVVEEEENQNFGMIMKIALLVLGGIVLCGGVAAIVLSSKKKKD